MVSGEPGRGVRPTRRSRHLLHGAGPTDGAADAGPRSGPESGSFAFPYWDSSEASGLREVWGSVLTRGASLLGTIRPGWACSTAVSAGDSSIMVPSRGNARSGRDEFRETFERPSAHGNPEPSRRYTGGRCRDYLWAKGPLITGTSIPHPHVRGRCLLAVPVGTGEEIVHSWRKRRGIVNPLVVGSNPTGPTN